MLKQNKKKKSTARNIIDCGDADLKEEIEDDDTYVGDFLHVQMETDNPTDDNKVKIKEEIDYDSDESNDDIKDNIKKEIVETDNVVVKKEIEDEENVENEIILPKGIF